MDNKKAKRLGKLLRERREALGLSALELGKRLDMSHTTILRIESGTFAEPRPDKLARIASALKLPLADVYATAGYGVPDDLPAPRAYFRMKLRDVPTRKADAIGREVEELLTRYGVNLEQGPAAGEDENDDIGGYTKSRKKGGAK